MGKFHPPYPAEFRQQIVELAKAGRSPSDLALEFGCTSTSIQNWVNRVTVIPPPHPDPALAWVTKLFL